MIIKSTVWYILEFDAAQSQKLIKAAVIYNNIASIIYVSS